MNFYPSEVPDEIKEYFADQTKISIHDILDFEIAQIEKENMEEY